MLPPADIAVGPGLAQELSSQLDGPSLVSGAYIYRNFETILIFWERGTFLCTDVDLRGKVDEAIRKIIGVSI